MRRYFAEASFRPKMKKSYEKPVTSKCLDLERQHPKSSTGCTVLPESPEGTIVSKQATPHAEKIAELERRNKLAEEAGGEARTKRQHDRGKLTARERVDILLSEPFLP